MTCESHVVRTHVEVIFTACAFLLLWAVLLKEGDRNKLREGVQQVMLMASSLVEQLKDGGAATAGLCISDACSRCCFRSVALFLELFFWFVANNVGLILPVF